MYTLAGHCISVTFHRPRHHDPLSRRSIWSCIFLTLSCWAGPAISQQWRAYCSRKCKHAIRAAVRSRHIDQHDASGCLLHTGDVRAPAFAHPLSGLEPIRHPLLRLAPDFSLRAHRCSRRTRGPPATHHQHCLCGMAQVRGSTWSRLGEYGAADCPGRPVPGLQAQ